MIGQKMMTLDNSSKNSSKLSTQNFWSLKNYIMESKRL